MAWQQQPQQLQQQQQQRMAAAGQRAPGARPVPAAQGQAGPEVYVVYSTGNDVDEVVVKTLVGEYVDQGSNHGRKVFKKTVQQGNEAVDVFLYYWDGRDGEAFSGWWFGNKLGGTQVWSHCLEHALTPPSSGWKIPWDGSVRPTLTVVSKSKQTQSALEEKLRSVNTAISQAEATARSALEQAAAIVGDFSDAENLRAAEQLLLPAGARINDALKRLMEAQRGSQGEVAKQLANLATALRATQTTLAGELTKIRASKSKADQSEKQRVVEERDMAAFQEVLPEATAKTNAAEDLVEKAMITSEMIAAGGDDLEEVRPAVVQTEQATQEAQKAIGEARIYLNAKQASSRRYESEGAREKASTEISKLQQQLQEAQNKLNPLKTVRQDFVQRAAAQKLVQEVLDKLSPAEVDVDRAEEATVMLSADILTKDMIAQADGAVSKAAEHMAAVTRFIDQKKKTTSGKAREELVTMEERAKTSQARLQHLKSSHKEAAERVTCDSLLKEAGERLVAVVEAVTKAADAEAPFLMGVEELPLEETLTAVKACEVAATAANTSVSIARMFLATKMVEAKRFSPGPSSSTQAKLKEYQSELGMLTKKLTDLKNSTALRKKSMTMREAEQEVQKAEDSVRRVSQAAAVFGDDAKLFELSANEIRAAADETIKTEQDANAALAEARKAITARQIESKGKDMSTEVSSELIKYQARLSAAQAEVGKYKKLSSTVEQRIAAKKMVDDATSKLKAAEEKVAKVTEIVATLGVEEGKDGEGGEADGEKSGNSVKDAEQAAAEAQVALKTLGRYLETQTRVQSIAKEGLANLQPLVKLVQEKLDATVMTMRERSEKIVVDGIVKESAARVKEAEASLQQVAEHEAILEKDSQELPIDTASNTLADLDNALTAAHAAVGGAKTFLAMKRLAAKRLAESCMKATLDQLTDLQSSLDAAAKKLAATKRSMAERKLAVVKREVSEKLVDVQAAVAAAEEATRALTTGNVELDADDMKGACEKAGTAQSDAQSVLAATRNLMLSRQRDAKNIAVDASTLGEIKTTIEKLSTLQADLDKHKAALRDQEHKFVAQRLLKDATAMVEKLESELKKANEAAATLTSDGADFKSTIFLCHTMDALRAYMRKTSKAASEILHEVGENGTVSETKFVALCQRLPELGEDVVFTEEQFKAAFARLGEGSSGEVAATDFLERLRSRYVCASVVSMTDSMAVKGGKTIRKLEIGEVVDGLEEAARDESVGLMRMRCKAVKDEKEGFVTVAGNQGTVYLQPHSPLAASQEKISQTIQECGDLAKETQKYMEQKSEELKVVRTGPLAETRTEIMKMRPRVTKVHYAQTQLKKKVADVDKRVKQCLEAERKQRQEAADKKAAAAMLEEVEGLVKSCTSEVEDVIPRAEALVGAKQTDSDDPFAAMSGVEKELTALLESIERTQARIKEQVDTMKTANKNPLSEARATLVKWKVKVGALDGKCKKQIAGLRTARKKVISEGTASVARVLRAYSIAKELSVDKLFTQLSKGQEEISVSSLCSFLQENSTEKVHPSLFAAGLERHAAGLTKLTFSELAQTFMACIKDIAITTAFEVKDSKTIRKLLAGEVVQVLELEQIDEATGLHRVRCRAFTDMQEGWVTLRGNHGTSFLEDCGKPYFCCDEDIILQTSLDSGSAQVCCMQPGEVLEVLQGPQRESSVEFQRVRGIAGSDTRQGWVTLKDSSGNANLELTKLIVCRQSIAITTTFDITEGKALRKLSVGEALEIVEGPQEDSVRSLTRVKARSKTDGKEGWVTVRGNQGTCYAEETDKHYICIRETSLQKLFSTDSPPIRTLEKGEVLEVNEGPKTETKEGNNRIKVHKLADGTEGWFTMTPQNVQPWSSQYECDASTTLTAEFNLKDSKNLRKLDAGERLEALATPILEKSAGMMRVRVRTAKDSLVGFATVRGNQGTVFLRPVVRGSQSVTATP